MMKMTRSNFAFVSALAGCLLFRLLPFRPPNVEPVLAAQMPLAGRFGSAAGFLFGFLSIALFDALTGKVGPWTLVTGAAYGALGLLAAAYFRGRNGVRQYAFFAIFATIFYDAATGLTVGPLFFNQPFAAAAAGQIPFTLYHLAGNVGFALTLSPLLARLFALSGEKAPEAGATRLARAAAAF